jgi:hypothetical protein
MSIALHMMEVLVLVLVLVLALVPIRVREEGLNCADVVVVVFAAGALTEEVAVEANGCLFDVTVMSNKIRVYRSRSRNVVVAVVVAVAVDKMRSILSALLVLISLPRILNLLRLHLFQQRHQLLLLQNRKRVVLGMCRRPLVLLQRRRLVRLSLQFK